MSRPRASRTIENALRRWGFARIAGVDEVGRGCLAGPVMAGAVVLDPGHHIAGLRDSKILSAAQRERLCQEIIRHALGWSVAAVEAGEIDRINIHRASLRAMRQAVLALVPLPDLVLVDAFRIPDLPMAQRGSRARRCPLLGHRRRLHRRQGRPGPADGASCTSPIPDTGSIATRATRPPSTSRAVARYGYSPAHRRSFRPASLFDRIESAPGPAEDAPNDR